MCLALRTAFNGVLSIATTIFAEVLCMLTTTLIRSSAWGGSFTWQKVKRYNSFMSENESESVGVELLHLYFGVSVGVRALLHPDPTSLASISNFHTTGRALDSTEDGVSSYILLGHAH